MYMNKKFCFKELVALINLAKMIESVNCRRVLLRYQVTCVCIFVPLILSCIADVSV